MLTPDDDDYELLGYGAQKQHEANAKHVGRYTEYMRLYMQQWRKDNPVVYAAIKDRMYTKRKEQRLQLKEQRATTIKTKHSKQS